MEKVIDVLINIMTGIAVVTSVVLILGFLLLATGLVWNGVLAVWGEIL